MLKTVKKRHFSPFKDNNSYIHSSDNFDSFKTFVGLIIRIIQQLKEFYETYLFWRYMRKTSDWPLCSIRRPCSLADQKSSHISSMQDTQKCIHNKFCINWSSSLRGEKLRRIVNDGRRQRRTPSKPGELKMERIILKPLKLLGYTKSCAFPYILGSFLKLLYKWIRLDLNEMYIRLT